MTIPYAQAVAGDKALTQLQHILEKFECSCFGIMQDKAAAETIVQFTWKERNIQLHASWGAYAIKLAGSEWRVTDKHVKQARISVCSALRDWVKGQITIVECGLMPFEEVFMAQVLLPNGKRLIENARQLYLSEENKHER